MRIWRISSYADLSGKGGMVAAGRWNPVKTPAVYCADHPASSLLEMLVHIDAEDAPSTFQLLGVDIPDDTSVHVPELPDGWPNDLDVTREIGARFISTAAAPLMQVPSIIVPFAWNYLLNPSLLASAGIHIASVTRHPIDKRLVSASTA